MTQTKKNKLVSIGLYLDEAEITNLKAAARKEGRSLSSYVRRLFFTNGCITTANPNNLKPATKRRKAA